MTRDEEWLAEGLLLCPRRWNMPWRYGTAPRRKHHAASQARSLDGSKLVVPEVSWSREIWDCPRIEADQQSQQGGERHYSSLGCLLLGIYSFAWELLMITDCHGVGSCNSIRWKKQVSGERVLWETDYWAGTQKIWIQILVLWLISLWLWGNHVPLWPFACAPVKWGVRWILRVFWLW